MKLFVEIFGWYGAGAIVLAYALVSFSWLSPTDFSYQLLNFTGAMGIVAISFYKRTYQPGVLNLIWAGIAFLALMNILVSGSTEWASFGPLVLEHIRAAAAAAVNAF